MNKSPLQLYYISFIILLAKDNDSQIDARADGFFFCCVYFTAVLVLLIICWMFGFPIFKNQVFAYMGAFTCFALMLVACYFKVWRKVIISLIGYRL